MDPTAAAYQGLPRVDADFYDRIREDKDRQLIEEFVVPIRSGKAWKVQSQAGMALTLQIPAGSICRISITDGAQVSLHLFSNILTVGGRFESVELQ